MQRIKKQVLREWASVSKLSTYQKMWLLAPIVIWFSYQPLVRLGRDSASNFELSVTLIYIAILAGLSWPAVWRSKEKLASNTFVLLVTGFVALSGISLFWTSNDTRGSLTYGVIGLLFAILLGAVAKAQDIKKITPQLVRVTLATACIMTGAALVQMAAAVWLDQSTTLLCNGCVPNQFGFARPNVFTIEPQFFGNVMLAPALLAAHIYVKNPHKRMLLVSAVIVSGLLLTLSRGAIFAFGIGLLWLLVLHRQKISAMGRLVASFAVAFVVCLFVQGSLAAMHPKLNTSFNGAVAASINQLSLGVIDIDKPEPKQTINSKPQSATTDARKKNAVQNEKPANFDGYVEESTNVRLKLSQLSLQAWSTNLQRTFFGVGLGGSGTTLRQQFPEQVNRREIVQNQYVEVLLEYGLLGFVIFISILIGVFYVTRAHRWVWALLFAYIVQWNFFSGYPNALHMYILFIVIVVTLGINRDTAKHKH